MGQWVECSPFRMTSTAACLCPEQFVQRFCAFPGEQGGVKPPTRRGNRRSAPPSDLRRTRLAECQRPAGAGRADDGAAAAPW